METRARSVDDTTDPIDRASDLLPLLVGMLPTLPTGPASAARYTIENAESVLPMTMQQLASASGTSDASVLRMVRTVGCTGYRDFRTRLAASLAMRPEEHILTAGISRQDSPGLVLTKLAAEERQAITDSSASVDPVVLAAAADAIVGARRVMVTGIGASGLVAHDLSAKLERVGLVSTAIVEGHAALTTAVTLRPDDVLVAISASGETRDVLEPMEAAAQRGTTTVAITARQRARVTAADHVLIAAAAFEQELRPAAMSSRTGQSFIVDALFILVLQRLPDAARDLLSASYEALEPRRRPRATSSPGSPRTQKDDHE